MVRMETLYFLIERWLADPHLTISLSPAAEVEDLRKQVRDLTAERDRIFHLYRSEVIINNRLTDLCKEYGLDWRKEV